jgi:hypothetical protein
MADVALDDLPAPPKTSVDELPAPPQSGGQRALNVAEDVAKEGAKGLVERAVAIPGLAADALTAAGNLANRGVNKVFGTKLPDEPMPTDALSAGIDKIIGKPKTAAGRAAELVTQMGPTARGIEAGERALFKMTPSQIANATITGQPLPEAERIARQAVDSGFRIPPSELPNAPVGRAVQSVTGKARAEEEMSAFNWKRTQDLARAEFHLPDGTEFTESTFDKLAQPGYDAYERLKGLNGGKPFNVTLDFLQDVGKAGETGGQAAVDFPGAPDERVLNLRGQYSQGQFTAPGAVQKIKELRNTWRDLVKGRNPADKAYAQANKDIADALEDELGRTAKRSGNGQLMSEYTNARQYLAKVFALRDSATLDGSIDPRALADQLNKGSKLTGNLKVIAESALQHPKAFQNVQNKGRMGPYTVHDLWTMMMGAGSAAGIGMEHHASPTGLAIMGAAAGSAARPLVRSTLGTKAAQKFMTRPSSQKVVNRAVREHGTPGNIAAAIEAATSTDIGEGGP